MSHLIGIIRQIVQHELARKRGLLLGVVSATYPHTDADDFNNYEVDVKLKHENLELRKIPVGIDHVGIAAPPRVGDLVGVQFVDGNINQPLITGRFYHADERPPLHNDGEIIFEQRVGKDNTLNQLRFSEDGSIYLQRNVKKPEDNTDATTSIKINGANGDVQIVVGDDKKVKIDLMHDGTLAITAGNKIEIKAADNPVELTCEKLTVTGAVDINGDLKVIKGGLSTTISGNEISGG